MRRGIRAALSSSKMLAWLAGALVGTACYATGARPGEPRQAVEVAAPTTVTSSDGGGETDDAPIEDGEIGRPDAGASEPPRKVHPFNAPMPGPALPSDAPAAEFANLSPAQCRARLRALGDAVRRSGDARGVATEVRLAGALHGVRFVTPGRRSKYGVLDCRLALALDALAELLASYDVVEVRIDNFHRPRARLPGSRKASQHSYGLAADITQLSLADGRRIIVERDWQTPVGDVPCGPEARLTEETDEAITLHNVVCDAVRAGMFNHVLSPSYDLAHRDHLHMDIKRGDRRRMLH